jgi:hypothetical protein
MPVPVYGVSAAREGGPACRRLNSVWLFYYHQQQRSRRSRHLLHVHPPALLHVLLLFCDRSLVGKKEAWRTVRAKIDRSVPYDVTSAGAVMNNWATLLAPVMNMFVASVEGRPGLEF